MASIIAKKLHCAALTLILEMKSPSLPRLRLRQIPRRHVLPTEAALAVNEVVDNVVPTCEASGSKGVLFGDQQEKPSDSLPTRKLSELLVQSYRSPQPAASRGQKSSRRMLPFDAIEGAQVAASSSSRKLLEGGSGVIGYPVFLRSDTPACQARLGGHLLRGKLVNCWGTYWPSWNTANSSLFGPLGQRGLCANTRRPSQRSGRFTDARQRGVEILRRRRQDSLPPQILAHGSDCGSAPHGRHRRSERTSDKLYDVPPNTMEAG